MSSGRIAMRDIAVEWLKDPEFRAEYEALCQRNGGVKMKAVVAVMRSGLRLLYSIARDRRLFTIEPPARRRAAA